VAAAFVFEFLAAGIFAFGLDLASPGYLFTNDLLHLYGGDV